MAFAFVQKNAGTFLDGGSTFSTSLTGVTAGNLVVCTVSMAQGSEGGPGAAPACPAPSGWSTAMANVGPSGTDFYKPVQGIFYKLSSAGGTETAAFSPTGTDNYVVTDISEYSYSGSIALDTTNHFEQGPANTSFGSGSATNSAATGLAIACGSADAYTVTSLAGPSSGFTQIVLSNTNASHACHASGYKVLSATAAQSASWTYSGSQSYSSGAIANFVQTGGTAAALAATPAAVTTLTAALSTAIRLAATPAGQVTLSAALTTGKPLAAAASAVTTLAAALTTQKRLNATPAVVVTVTAALSTAKPLAAGASSVCTLTADLTGGTSGLQAAAAAQTTVSAALSTQIRLAAAAADAVTLSAALTTQKRLNAAVSSVVTVSGTLVAGGAAAALQASIQGAVTLTASLTGGSAATVTRAGSEIIGRASHNKRIPERHFKPLLQRVLDARYPRVKPAKERAAKRAKAIEVEAAQLIVDDPYALKAFEALMARWANEGPAAPPGIDLRPIFEAQVGFRLRQLALEQAARLALAEQRARDEDDALMALLLA